MIVYKEVIKALNCCAGIETPQCETCDYRIYQYKNCQKAALKDVIAILEIQKANIDIKQQRLNNVEMRLRFAKEEALREFEERLEENTYVRSLSENGTVYKYVSAQDINKIAAEMMGEKDNV